MIPCVLNGELLTLHLPEIPVNALKVYLLLMLRLCRINFHTPVLLPWGTNIVIYPDGEIKEELRLSQSQLDKARKYLLDNDFFVYYKHEYAKDIYHIINPTITRRLAQSYENRQILKDRQFLVNLKVLPEEELERIIELSAALKEWRTLLNISHKEAAIRFNVMTITYRNWERGIQPCEINLIKIKKTLNHFGIKLLGEL